MWWNAILLSLSLLPGSHALDPNLSLAHSTHSSSVVSTILKRKDDGCGPGTMSGSEYCPTCEGIDTPTPNMLIKCQDRVDKTSDDQNNAYQEQHGECRVYHPLWPEASTGQEQPKCTRWCKSQESFEEGDVAACVGFTLQTGDSHFDENFFYSFRDAEGRYYEMGECVCDMALAGLVLDVVFEGIAEAMELIGPILFIACKLFAGVIELAADASLSALPGGAAITASRKAATTAVRAAKTTHQNGGSEKTFQDLSTLMCPHVNFGKLDFGKGFNKLLGVSDDYAKGDGCKAKKRSLEGRAKGSKGGDDDHERIQCRDLPRKSKDQPPDNDRDNGMEGREDRARKEHEDKNKPKATSEPSKTTSTSSGAPDPTKASCAFCDPVKPKLSRREDETSGYGLMYARAPPDKGNDKTNNDRDDCIRRDGTFLDDDILDGLADLELSDEACTAASNFDRRSLDPSPLFGLEKRGSTTSKKAKLVLPSGNVPLEFGRYPPCKHAKSKDDIMKYYRFRHDPNHCLINVEKIDLAAATKNKELYHTEHVYEAQTLSRFLSWLAEGGEVYAGSTFQKPTESWVREVIVNTATNTFKLVSKDVLGTPAAGDFVFDIMAYGFGRSDRNAPLGPTRGLKLLTLAQDAINEPKGVLFGGNNLDLDKIKAKSALPTDLYHVRRGVATFEYLKFAEKGKTSVWELWMKVSNWIDLVCHTFDEQYPWGTITGEPTAPGAAGGKASLRALYAYWIDQELAGMEGRMAVWATNAKQKFDDKYKNPKGQVKIWRDNAFGKDGYATASKLVFPQPSFQKPVVGASKYGAYGIYNCTLDKDEKKKDIGVPIKVL